MLTGRGMRRTTGSNLALWVDARPCDVHRLGLDEPSNEHLVVDDGSGDIVAAGVQQGLFQVETEDLGDEPAILAVLSGTDLLELSDTSTQGVGADARLLSQYG